MIIKGKKGQRGSQQLLFYAAELIVGAFILYIAITLGMSLMSEKPQEIIAQDLGYTLMSVAASPSNMYFAYQPDTRGYRITIRRDNKVQVELGKEGKAEFNFYLLKNILIDPAILNNIKSIPITFKDKLISFQTLDQSDKENICNTMPASFNPIQNYVSIKYPASITKDEKAFLNSVKTYLETKSKLDSKKNKFSIEDTTISASINIYLRFNNKNGKILTVNYYAPPNKNANNAKIACYISAEMQTINNLFTNTEEVATSDTSKDLDVELGSFNVITTNKISAESIGDKIYSAISKAIKK